MKLYLYAIRDRVAQSYGTPFYFSGSNADKLAQRAFGEARADKSCPIGKSPDDYELWAVGVMSLEDGRILGSDGTITYPCKLV